MPLMPTHLHPIALLASLKGRLDTVRRGHRLQSLPHRQRIEAARTFEYSAYESPDLTPERRAALVSAVLAGDVYMVGGRSAELQQIGGSQRTPLETYAPTPPIAAESRRAQRSCSR